MFERDAIACAVDLQRRSYQLLRWMTAAIDRGFIAFGDAHEFASLSAATFVWIDRHYADLPPAARPPRDDLRPFCNLFATYLESSFELLEDPGMRHCGCDCYCCGTLVEIPRLKLKKLTPQDRRARDVGHRRVTSLPVASDPERETVRRSREVRPGSRKRRDASLQLLGTGTRRAFRI